MPGSPDFQTYAQWRSGNVAASVFNSFATGLNYFNLVPMQSWAAIHVRIQPTAGYGQVILTWFNDLAQTEQIGQDVWGVSAGTSLMVEVPAEGPYCQISINVQSAVNLQFAAYIAGINNPIGRFTYPVSAQRITETNISLAAGASADYYLPWITDGDGCLSFSPLDTTGQLSVSFNAYNPDGTRHYIAQYFGAPTALLNSDLCVPDDISGVRVVNNDGANAHTFSLYVIAHSR